MHSVGVFLLSIRLMITVDDFLLSIGSICSTSKD